MRTLALTLCVVFTLLGTAHAQNGLADPPLSPFGIGSGAARSRDLGRWMPQMAAIGLRVMRCASPDHPGEMDT